VTTTATMIATSAATGPRSAPNQLPRAPVILVLLASWTSVASYARMGVCPTSACVVTGTDSLRIGASATRAVSPLPWRVLVHGKFVVPAPDLGGGLPAPRVSAVFEHCFHHQPLHEPGPSLALGL
jgi:hypothetical protein